MKDHTSAVIIKVKKDTWIAVQDEVIREVPLLIRINGSPCATLMRTPGQEKELALGFCFTEGILSDSWKEGGLQWEEPKKNCIGLLLDCSCLSRPVMSLMPFADSAENPAVEVAEDEEETVTRIFPSLSGRIESQLHISLLTLQNIENQSRHRQALFALTGATHAACIFDREGNYLFCFEDMARHNALDKAIGHALLCGEDLSDKILFLSGRTNCTLIRKAAKSRIPVVASVSAPTSLAVSLSKKVGMTLIGFLRPGGMNIYAGQERIKT
ncbi:MAG: formate dehydrogenase accessory sulfurtransferase FdhD [bacterium]